MIFLSLFLLANITSVVTLVIAFRNIEHHRKMYRMPKEYALNGKSHHFRKRYIMTGYIIVITLLIVYGSIITYYAYKAGEII